jgi:hypothetical protein
MKVLSFEKSLEKKYQNLRFDMHALIEARPGSGIAKGIMELQLYKMKSTREKINFLEKEIKSKGINLGKITAKTYENWEMESQKKEKTPPIQPIK